MLNKELLLNSSFDITELKQERYKIRLGATEMKTYIGFSEGVYGNFGSITPNTFNGVRIRAFATDIAATTLVLDDTKRIPDDVLKV